MWLLHLKQKTEQIYKVFENDIILTGTPITPMGGPQYDCLVKSGDKLNHTIEGVGEVNYDELTRRLKVEKSLSDSIRHHSNKAKYLLNVNPIGFIIGGNSSIGFEKYTINNWTLN